MDPKPLQLKRGSVTNLPLEAPSGSPVVALDSEELYIGQGMGLPLFKVGQVVISSSAPSNINKLWVNITNDTISYYNGLVWKQLGSSGALSSIVLTPTLAGRDAIAEADRIEGLEVFVIEDQKVYILVGGILNSNWTTPNTSDLYTNASPSVIAVGGIPIGTTFNKKPVTDILTDMLYPELFPTLVNPSGTFTLTQEGLQEVGATLATLNFGATFNRGTITPAYTTNGFRAGLPNAYIYTGSTIGGTKASTSLTDANTISNYVVTLGAQSWTGKTSYDAGQQPLSSKGNNFNTPLTAGNTNAVTRTITGVYPFFATTVGITTQTKQALVAHNSTYFAATMVAESGINKQTVWLPAAFSPIVGIQFYNTVSSAWEWLGGTKANSLLLFTVTDVNITVNSVSVAYKKYTHNSSTIGARQLRFYTV